MALPDTYKQGEYIELTGTQYIDVGFKVDSTRTRVVLDFELYDDSRLNCIFGARTSANIRRYDFIFSTSGVFESYYLDNTAGVIMGVSGLGRHIVDKNGRVTSVGGSSVTDNNSISFTTDYNMFLGTINAGGTALSQGMSGRIYSCQIYEGGAKVRDFVPCINSSGEVGLYDLANDKFYGNSGTGVFTIGGIEAEPPKGYVNILGSLKPLTGKVLKNKGGILCPITTSSKVNIANVLRSLLIGEEVITSRLPKGYTEVEYIKSTGTQYINTGYKPNNNTRVTADFEFTKSGSDWRSVFGARDSDLARCFGLFYSTDDRFYSNIGGKASTHFFSSAISVLGRHTADLNKNIATIDTESYTHTAETFQNTTTLYLFANNEAGALGMLCDMKLYSCQIYEGGAKVRDFVPCKNSSGTAGLFDLVNNVFYGNNGTGSFTAGAAV